MEYREPTAFRLSLMDGVDFRRHRWMVALSASFALLFGPILLVPVFDINPVYGFFAIGFFIKSVYHTIWLIRMKRDFDRSCTSLEFECNESTLHVSRGTAELFNIKVDEISKFEVIDDSSVFNFQLRNGENLCVPLHPLHVWSRNHLDVIMAIDDCLSESAIRSDNDSYELPIDKTWSYRKSAWYLAFGIAGAIIGVPGIILALKNYDLALLFIIGAFSSPLWLFAIILGATQLFRKIKEDVRLQQSSAITVSKTIYTPDNETRIFLLIPLVIFFVLSLSSLLFVILEETSILRILLLLLSLFALTWIIFIRSIADSQIIVTENRLIVQRGFKIIEATHGAYGIEQGIHFFGLKIKGFGKHIIVSLPRKCCLKNRFILGTSIYEDIYKHNIAIGKEYPFLKVDRV